MRRVRDRERKWFRRNTVAGRLKRLLEYQARRKRRPPASETVRPQADAAPRSGSQPVGDYRDHQPDKVSCDDALEVFTDDQETTVDSRSRPPPAS